MYPYRILTMDGGGVLSLLSLVLLRRIEAARPGFLESVHLISGTSAGGVNALLIAGHQNPQLGLQQALNLWLTQRIYGNDPLDRLRAIAGQSAIASNDTLHDYLLDSIGDITLGGLFKKVVIPSLDMNGILRGQETWKPKIFNNYGLNEPDRLESAVDVALRTCAAPVTFPIYQGYADGGLFANNPSMCALAQVLTETRRPAPVVEAELPAGQQDVVMLSLGAGLNETAIEVGDPNWGWWRWLFDSQAPLAVIEAVAENVPMVVDYQCASLLSERYFRLNPPLPNHINRQFPGQQRKTLYTLGMEYPLEPVLAWIDRVDWFDTRGTAGTSAAAAAAADDTVKPAARKTTAARAARKAPAKKAAAPASPAKKTAAKKTTAPKKAAARKTTVQGGEGGGAAGDGGTTST
jgi:patatin-like phospholipase/acyl hydrolase